MLYGRERMCIKYEYYLKLLTHIFIIEKRNVYAKIFEGKCKKRKRDRKSKKKNKRK